MDKVLVDMLIKRSYDIPDIVEKHAADVCLGAKSEKPIIGVVISIMKKIFTPLISDFMMKYRNEYGFDTIAARRETLNYLSARNKDNLILDVGTGSGWMAILAVEQAPRVVSIDMDANNLIRARDRAKQILKETDNFLHFIQADAFQIPFQDNCFDAVLSFNAIHHLFDRSCPTGIKEMIRVCKTSGDIIIADLNKNGVDVVRAVHAKAGLEHKENRCDVEELEMMLGDIGLRTTRNNTPFITIFHANKYG